MSDDPAEPVTITIRPDLSRFRSEMEMARQRLDATGYRRIPLRTGPLVGRRVDHARLLRMHTWYRRRERRHGIPSGELAWSRIVIPSAQVSVWP